MSGRRLNVLLYYRVRGSTHKTVESSVKKATAPEAHIMTSASGLYGTNVAYQSSKLKIREENVCLAQSLADTIKHFII